jgi:Leucine Rich repeat
VQALAHCIEAVPGHSSAATLQARLPVHLHSAVAAAVSARATNMSPGLRAVLPQIAFADCPVLALPNTRLRLSDALYLQYFALANSALTVLTLSSCRLDAAGARAVACIISGVSTLQSVDVSYNPLGAQGAAALLQAVSSSKSMLSLAVAGCAVAEGAAAIAAALAVDTQLQALNLAYNDLGAQGAAALAAAVRRNSTLTSLNLRGNCLKEVGGRVLAKALLANSGALKELNIADNRMGAQTAALVAACMRGGVADVVRGFGGCRSNNSSVTGSVQSNRTASVTVDADDVSTGTSVALAAEAPSSSVGGQSSVERAAAHVSSSINSGIQRSKSERSTLTRVSECNPSLVSSATVDDTELRARQESASRKFSTEIEDALGRPQTANSASG